MEWVHEYFLNEATRALPVFQGQYAPGCVAASVMTAVVASFFAFEMAGRFAARGYRNLWLPFGALVLGIGIWSMHFIGMMAYRLEFGIAYDAGLFLLSLLAAFALAALAVFARA